MEAIEIRNLSFSYPNHRENALNHVSLTVHCGEFVVLCGPSGCGKSTLLRQLKTVLAPHGRREGEILVEGTPLQQMDQRQQSQRIGFVQQSPDNQLVTDKVWHELAFGLESLGYDTPLIRRRVAEMASFFGIEAWFYKDVSELSGGQKQLLNLASVMAMQPSVLILDEPTSQLDPIAASDFLAAIGKINRELGITILLTEHRLEEVFPLADTVAVMESGSILCSGTPEEVGLHLRREDHSMFLAMPAAMRIWAGSEDQRRCPVTVRDGRDWLRHYAAHHTVSSPTEDCMPPLSKETVISAQDLWFRYEKDKPDVVRGLTLTVQRGEFLALLGGNGTGKSTTLKLLSGLEKPYRGAVSVKGRMCVLPQDPQSLFVKKTLREDLLEILGDRKLSKEDRIRRVARVVQLCRLGELLDRHPYDLSGGEQQRAALAKVLLLEPEILLMDEPTKGLDAEFKEVFAEIIRILLSRHVTILMVSHDIEFCARHARRCAMFFDGSIVAEASPRTFFSGNSFYTTSANRIARELLPEAVTPEDVIRACGGKVSPSPELPEEEQAMPEPRAESDCREPQSLPRWRKLLAWASGGVAAAIFLYFMGVTDLSSLVGAGGLTVLSLHQLCLYGICILSLLVMAASITRRSPHGEDPLQTPKEKRKLPIRTVAAALVILLMIPATLFLGQAYGGGKKYAAISLAILVETMLPFFLVFEGRKPKARELVVVAVLCALGVAGRAIFFMLPEFKPVWAIAILSGVAFGGETGFLVGSMTMLASNILFGQGAWTPWQMFSMGLVGFLAGVLFRKGLLRRSRGSLCIYGALACFLIYGGLMNASSALMASSVLSWRVLLAYYVTGFPIDCVHALSTCLFLWLGAEPMLEKLDRIKVKYGLVE